MYATLYAKYANNYSVGMFTRDFRSNINYCRILCTVPYCLEILLLSSLHEHQHFCKRIKYVIFDEMHCMSIDDAWEKCMMLLDSPMIGLSATVNNGLKIKQWLEAIERRRYTLNGAQSVRRIRLIVSHKRLTDLRKYLYSEGQLHPIHPIGLMDSEQILRNGCLSSDLSLSPKETLKLYDIIKDENNNSNMPLMKQYSGNIPSLEEYFQTDWIIEREKFDSFGKLIFQQFNKMVLDKNLSLINLIRSQLSSNLINIQYPQSSDMQRLIKDFVVTLQKNDQLPCIVFCGSRHQCEEMAHHIIEYLKNKENEIRETKSFQEKMKEIIEKVRASRKKMYSPKLSGIEERMLNGILSEGTLTTRQPSEIEEKFLHNGDKLEDFCLSKYIQRGVAFHHAGMNKSQRAAVEALFRSGYLKVVFATSTLATGIHMPCKTVAFNKDSVWLDALYFRQASGRSGRRGFDVEGN